MNWYDNQNSIVELWYWLDEKGETPEMPLFIEKPWKWTPEFEQYENAEKD